MKSLCASAGVALLFTVMSSQSTSSRNEDGLSGPVKTVLVERAQVTEASGKRTEGPRRTAGVYSYNAQGNKIEEHIYNDAGALVVKRTFGYDPQGRLAESFEYDAAGNTLRKSVYTYDEEGKLKQTDMSKDDVVLGTSVQTHDREAGLVEVANYSGAGRLIVKIISTVDESGKVTEARYCSGETAVSAGLRVGPPAKENVFREVGAAGVDPGSCGGGALIAKNSFKYDAKGNLVEQSVQGGGAAVVRTAFEYDDGGALAETAEYDAAGTLVRREGFTRTFDGRGNWIKEIKTTLDSRLKQAPLIEVSYRRITYY